MWISPSSSTPSPTTSRSGVDCGLIRSDINKFNSVGWVERKRNPTYFRSIRSFLSLGFASAQPNLQFLHFRTVAEGGMTKFGFEDAEWERAKREIREILVDRAKVRGMIPYSELSGKIRSVQVEAHDPRLFHLLGEVSTEEDASGRGMLSVIVVHKSGDMQPGPGFFELAKSLGRDTSDILHCWMKELKKVHAHWSIP
jgi:hypothetical protein